MNSEAYICDNTIWPFTLMIKLIKYLILASIIILPILTLLPTGIGDIVQPVYAAGSNVTTIYIPGANWAKQLIAGTTYTTWENMYNQTSSDTAVNNNGNQAGWTCWTGTQWATNKSVISFDISSILSIVAAGGEIKNIRIVTNQKSTTSSGSPSDWYNAYFSYDKTIKSSHSIATSDWRVAITQQNIPVFDFKRAIDIPTTSTTEYWTMRNSYLNTFISWKDSSNYIYFTFSSMNEQLNAQPTTYAGSKINQIDDGGGTSYLEVTYASSATPRNAWHYPGTGAINPMPTGTENATSITWETPRCAYTDEDISFYINGDWGANVTMQLVNDSGVVLATKSDSIRKYPDGAIFYNWIIPAGSLPANSRYWIQCKEINFGLVSTWGRVEPAPSPTEKNLKVYAVDTVDPQYTYDFSNYIVSQDNIMIVSWKTNIVQSEANSYELNIAVGGDNITGAIFSESLYNLANDYYLCSTNNCFMLAWRYMIICPKIVSITDGNGIVKNMNQDYSQASCGFWLPTINAVSDDSYLTYTHSCYYYLNNSNQGVSIGIDSNLDATVTIGNDSKVALKLPLLTAQEIDNSGTIVSNQTGSAQVGTTTYQLPMVQTAGSFTARFTFSDDTSIPYDYIHDIPFTAQQQAGGKPGTVLPPEQGTSIKGWLDWLNSLLKKYGMDNEAGHWLVIFIICVVLVVLLRKHPTVLTAMILLILAGAFVAKWINPWFIILCAIGAGLWIYNIFRRKEQGQT